jgi:hypothetical protein
MLLAPCWPSCYEVGGVTGAPAASTTHCQQLLCICIPTVNREFVVLMLEACPTRSMRALLWTLIISPITSWQEFNT